MVKNKKIAFIRLSSILLFLTSLSIVSLTLPHAHAEDIIDEVNIAVPIACSMSATTTSEHTSDVINGQTVNNIGTTNLKVICNDNSGYAIYAIGYTDDTYGKTVLSSPTLSASTDIITSATTTADTSSWAMKLAAVSGTYAPIIAGSSADTEKQTSDPDYSAYQAVPATYTKVAYHTSSTDTGNNATGSNLTTTYRAYISPTQPAGTYVGQVKYTLVHPYNRRAPGIPVNRQIQVTYDATNSGYFDNDPSVTTNVVTYDATCESEDKEYEIVKSQNLDDDGNKVSSFTTDDGAWGRITIQNASKLKVILNYDFAFNEGNNDGENGVVYVCDFDEYGHYNVCREYFGTGSQTIIINDNTVEIESSINSEASIDSSHDYGFYARVYPLDENNEEYTYEEYHDCTWTVANGTYKEPKSSVSGCWFERWQGDGGFYVNPYDSEDMINQILQHYQTNNITLSLGLVC